MSTLASTPLPPPSHLANVSIHSPPPVASAPAALSPTQPSTRKACDSCRLSKARCEPLMSAETASLGKSSEAGGVCQRCAKTGRRCVFGERSRRRKRRKTDSGDDGDGEGANGDKVSRLEKKLSILEARLGTTKLPSGDRLEVDENYGYYTLPTTTSEPSMPASTSSPAISQPLSSSPRAPINYGIPLLFYPDKSRSTPPKPKPVLQPDVLSRNVLSLSNATALYTHFINNMLPHIPFFIATNSLAQIRNDKPLLFIAILTVAAASTGAIELHQRLLEETYETLLRLIIEGEKSIELVQAIITMVNWYQPPASIEKSRIWMLTMQASAIAVDLNLGSSADLDDRRALLTCYSCNACISIVLRRPVFLRYGKRIQESLELLGNSGVESDRTLAAYVTLVLLMEEAFGACGVIDGDLPTSNPQVVSWVLDTFYQKATEHRKKTADFFRSSLTRTSMAIAYHGAAIQVLQIGLETPGRNTRAQARLLQAAHETLEAFLACPSEILKSCPFHVFSRTANAASLLLRLASASLGERNNGNSSVTPELRANGRLEHLRIPHYLQALTDRFQELLCGGGGGRTLVMSLALLEGMRAYYNSIAPPPPSAQEEGETLAAASILCGTPAAYPQYQQPPPVPQMQPFAMAGVGLSQEEIEKNFLGIDGQIMMGASGGGGMGIGSMGMMGWPQWGAADGMEPVPVGQYGWAGA